MEGYLKNTSSEWAYAMKRSIRPGGEVPLAELYEQYGVQYDMKPGEEFLTWLQTVKLKNSDKWKIVYDFNKTAEKVENAEPKTSEVQVKSNSQLVTPMVAKKIQVEDIVNLSVRKAREVLPKITDAGLLKFSLNEARQMTDKDSLCRLLNKRIQELQISR